MKLSTGLSLTLLSLLTTQATAQFNPLEATIDSVHSAIYSKQATCRQVVEAFLARVPVINPAINAIITMNPNALATADATDLMLSNSSYTPGPLFCVPIYAKDNYDTADMPTTAGCLALKDNQPTVDTPSIAALRSAGAIILGKTNLHELALDGLTCSSMGGQTHNPYDLTRTPGGSSGGSGAATAASLAVLSLGSDTVNSIRSPAASNSLVGIRPSQGLMARSGVQPCGYTQDTIGPIARTVRDAAIALSVMASTGYDVADNKTALGYGKHVADYTKYITGTALQTKPRIGVPMGLFSTSTTDPEVTEVNRVVNAAIQQVQAAGAEIVYINDPTYNSTAMSALYDVQQYEFRQTMDAYLDRPTMNTNITSVKALVATGQYYVDPSYAQWYTSKAFNYSTWSPGYAQAVSGISQNISLTLLKTFVENNLTALLYPEQRNLVVKIGSATQGGRNGILAAVTGAPVVCIQAGFSSTNVSSTAPLGIPIGIELLGLPFADGPLIDLADSIESLLRVRKTPALANITVQATSGLSAVPMVTPNQTLPYPYKLGPALTVA